MKNILLYLFLILVFKMSAQTDSTQSPISVSGYIETYYAYDFGKPSNHLRPSFIYAYNRHNEVNLNLGFIKAAYNQGNVRANLALMTGTYANANLAAEAGVLKNIYEANAGVKVSKNENLWLDAGVFASHIGFESAIGKDCWTLTRSMAADNSPYYESGVKLTYTSTDAKWLLSALILNGWQRIQRVDGNNTIAVGHQLTFKPNDKMLFNSSSFIGNDMPDSVQQMRYFHNFYSILQLNDKWGITLGFDIGSQKKAPKNAGSNIWYTPVFLLKFSPTYKTNLVARFEYYSDKNQVIIAPGTANGFQTMGYSLNFDYSIYKNALWRIEARSLNSKDKVFINNSKPNNANTLFVTALAISF